MQQLEADNGYPKDFEVISAKVKDKKYTSVVSACWKFWKTTVYYVWSSTYDELEGKTMVLHVNKGLYYNVESHFYYKESHLWKSPLNVWKPWTDSLLE